MRRIALVGSALCATLGCATAARSPAPFPGELQAVVTLEDLSAFGVRPSGTISESWHRMRNPGRRRPASLELGYRASAVGGAGTKAFLLVSEAGRFGALATAEEELERRMRNFRLSVQHMHSPSFELRNEIVSGGDESCFWVVRNEEGPLAYVFQMREGDRAFHVLVMGYANDTPDFWRALLEPHIRAVARLEVYPDGGPH